MKKKLQITAIFIVLALSGFSQPKTGWEKWTWLMGEWQGEGSGQPGQGGGTFEFAFDLDKNVIVRKSHSEYPATENTPETIHDDLMIIYVEGKSEPKAIYFDNEGHTINYSISFGANSIVMTSSKVENTPVFRLTYTLLDDNRINTAFEMSQDGQNFMTYLEGKSEKIK